MTDKALRVGINIDGAMHDDGQRALSLNQQVELIKDDFDYFEKTLHAGENLDDWLRAGERHDVPLGVLGGIFDPVQDLERAKSCVELARQAAVNVINCQVRPPATRGAQEIEAIGAFCLALFEHGEGRVQVCLEPHVDMWLEQFDRVEPLAQWMHARGAKLQLTIDHSHLIYRVDNPVELHAAGIESQEEGRRLLMPDSSSAYYRRWLDDGLIRHAHARCVQINAPANAQCERAPGVPGRGIQYPLVLPSQPDSVQGWDAARCTPWKTAVTDLLRWRHRRGPDALNTVSCEFIPYPDYGGGQRYSIIEQNRACAAWLRETDKQLRMETPAS